MGVTKPNHLPPRTKKADVPVKPASSLLNLASKPWKLNLKKPKVLPPPPTTSSKMPKERARKPKPSLLRMLKKKTNTKPRLVAFKKNSNWLIPELNSLKDLSTSPNHLSTVSSNHS